MEEIERNEEIEQEKPQVDTDELKARSQGWVPKEDFKGNPDKWVDAKAFNDRGEKIMPILRERNHALERKMEEMQSTFKEFSEFHKKTEERAFQRAMRELQARKEAAVEVADVDTFRQIEREQLEMMQDRQQTSTPKQPQQMESPPAFNEFVARNEWYNSDPEMRAYADNMGHFINSTRSVPYETMLLEVEKEVKSRYPHKFSNIKRETLQPVEGVSETGIPHKNTKKGYADLPPEAKAACDRFVKNIPGYTKEVYLKDYFGE